MQPILLNHQLMLVEEAIRSDDIHAIDDKHITHTYYILILIDAVNSWL